MARLSGKLLKESKRKAAGANQPKSNSALETVPGQIEHAEHDLASEEREDSMAPAGGSKTNASTDSESEDDGDEGVDDEGMKRLMAALGDEGLDDFDAEQLRMLGGEEQESDGEGDDENDATEDEADQEDVLTDTPDGAADDLASDNSSESGDNAIPLDEADFVDEDAVPRQKLEIDNAVWLPLSVSAHC
jgi:rRNA-processing protein EBP2